MKKSVPFVYHELIEAFKQPGCPVCRLVQRSTEKYLENLFYEDVNDSGSRNRLRKSLGFCKEHAYLVLNSGIGDALGIAIIYHDVFRALLKRLPQEAEGTRTSSLFALLGQIPRRLADQIKTAVQALTPQARCPACVQEEKSTDLYVSELVNAILKDELYQGFMDSDGLCIPHLRQAFEHVQDDESYEKLLNVHRQKFEVLDQELAELIRKSDYRFHDEGFGHERNAWMRAVHVVVGEKQ